MQSIMMMNKSSFQADCCDRTREEENRIAALLDIPNGRKQLSKKRRPPSGALLVLGMKEGMIDIWPELFEHEGGSIDTDVEAPFLRGVAEGSLACRIVQVRDAGGCASAHDFADIEGCSAGIGPRNDGAAESITGAL